MADDRWADVDIARELRDAGLAWNPVEGDRFVLPDHELVDEVFLVSRMVTEVRTVPAGRVVAFNGTTEWALDAVEQSDALWLPSEAQLRLALGETFLSLARLEDGVLRCTVQVDDGLVEAEADTAADAYGRALLAVLRR